MNNAIGSGLTADGQLRTCLFSITETDLLTPLRAGAPNATIEDLIIEAVKQKEPGHQINASKLRQTETKHVYDRRLKTLCIT